MTALDTAAPVTGRQGLADAWIDRDHLADLRAALGASEVARLIDLMLSDITRRSTDIIIALRNADEAGAARQAHALRGAAAGIGAYRLVEACREIETSRLDAAADQAKRLAEAARRSCTALRRVRTQLVTSSA